jgi:hypothetical protein
MERIFFPFSTRMDVNDVNSFSTVHAVLERRFGEERAMTCVAIGVAILAILVILGAVFGDDGNKKTENTISPKPTIPPNHPILRPKHPSTCISASPVQCDSCSYAWTCPRYHSSLKRITSEHFNVDDDDYYGD